MENKVLIKLIIPDTEESYDIFIPISKRIGNIINLVIKAANEIGASIESNSNQALYNKKTGEKYDPNALVYETNIRNGSEIVLI